VRREIRLARREGKTVSPVKGPGIADISQLPRWLGETYDLNVEERRTLLLRVLQGPSTQKRSPMMAPEPPADFVQRPAEFNDQKARLLDAKGDAVAITAAFRGAGGYGKTTLAKALAYDPDVQDAYFDGILWVELGENPENLLSIISDLVEILSGKRPGLENINGAAAKLGEALGDRRILMVVDDAWREQHLRPFLQGGASTTRLVTTRDDNILPTYATRQIVDAMQAEEALALLAAGLPADQVRAAYRELSALATRVGEWALLLKLVNGFLNRAVGRGQVLPLAIGGVNSRLDEKGLVAFDSRNEADRAKAVARTIGVSLEHIDIDSRRRFGELGIFPEDTHVPIGIVERLWRETGPLDSIGTEDLLNDLYSLSLLLDLDLERRTLKIHDTIRQFLRDRAGEQKLLDQHKSILRILEAVGGSVMDELSRRYYYLCLPYHLAQANERKRLDALLLDPRWLTAKLVCTATPTALVADYDQYARGEAQSLIGRTLRLTVGICARDQRQLIPQLLGRLMQNETVAKTGFLKAARQQVLPPAILHRSVSLTPPGAEIARLENQSDWVHALCMLPDGRLASGDMEGSIRLWDLKTYSEHATLKGHSGNLTALCMLPDGRLASGGFDGTIRLWDLRSGSQAASFEVFGLSTVTALCALPDGCLASGCFTGIIQVWDLKTGSETGCIKAHLRAVTAFCMLPDGRLSSSSDDNSIRLWDVNCNAETARLEGHTGSVKALCVLADGRLASGGHDRTIRLWDLTCSAETDRIECDESPRFSRCRTGFSPRGV
jgi:hypothetical protein